MATVSSHILDSVNGGSASGIRVALVRVISVSERETVFDLMADNEGRISESVPSKADSEYELIFYSTEYFSSQTLPEPVGQMLTTVVIRFFMAEDSKRYHIPLMLAPHSYSVWWS